MKGAAYVGGGRLKTVSVDVAPPGPGELQIAVAYCGLCGTDLHIVHGDMDARVTRCRARWRRSAPAWRAGWSRTH